MVDAQHPVPFRTGSERITARIDAGVVWFARHWAYGLAALAAPIVLMPLLAPLLEAKGYHNAARAIFFMYGFVCHQRPERSFHLLGEQMAFCARDFAIALTVLVALVFIALVPRVSIIRPASLSAAVIASIPMAVDGSTQLVGLRESTAELRLVTGVLFAIGWAWFALPRMDAGFRNVIAVVTTRSEGTAA